MATDRQTNRQTNRWTAPKHYAALAVASGLIIIIIKRRRNQVRGRSKSLKMALFDRPYATLYWSAIVTIALMLYLVPFSSYVTLNNIVTLKSGLEVTQGH